MLEVFNYTKKYGRTIACRDISFSLPDGSVTVLLGPNGAGKSTLMKGIIGFLRFEGKILVNGRPNVDPKSRREIGYIPEIPSFYPNLSVSEHMEFVARAYRMKDYRERAEELLTRFALTEHRKKMGSELSKGMAQKLNICLGLFTKPSVLLLDEPFIGLDPHAIKELKNTIEDLRGQGATLLISTHIIDSVDMLWDSTIIMQGGLKRAQVSREELEAGGETLEHLFFSVTEGEGYGGDLAQRKDWEKDAGERKESSKITGENPLEGGLEKREEAAFEETPLEESASKKIPGGESSAKTREDLQKMGPGKGGTEK